MTKSELIGQIAETYPDITKKQVKFIVDNVFDLIKETLKKGDKVEIRSFGSFNIRTKNKKNGVNPRSGERVMIPEKKAPYFRPSKEIKASLLKS